MQQVCVASCSELISSGFENASESYASSGTDEKYLFRALDGTISYEVRDWNDDTGKPWSDYSLILVRTTWDYSKSEIIARQFRKWLDSLIDLRVKVFNHPLIMKWNMHKSYLSDLGLRGVPVIPTVLVAAGSTSTFGSKSLLLSIMAENKWSDVMIKPAIGGGSRACMRVLGNDVDAVTKANAFLVSYTSPRQGDDEGQGDNLVGSGDDKNIDEPCDMLVQPYLSSVEAHGEISVIVIDGKVSHLVQKKPVNGDFRTQEEWGASISNVPMDHPLRETASNLAIDILKIAKDCVKDAPEDSLMYARVDFLTLTKVSSGKQDEKEESGDSLVLLELELIEPCLFLANSESNECAERIVKSLQQRS